MDKAELKKQGVDYYTREEVLKMVDENAVLKRKLQSRLYSTVFLTVIFLTLIFFFSKRLLIPNVGAIGVFNPAGEVQTLSPRINPRLSPEEVYNFAIDRIVQVRTMFFLSYYDDLGSQEEYFTHSAFTAYLEALRDSGDLQRVIDEHLNVTASVSRNQRIYAGQIIQDGELFWYVEADLDLRIENSSGIDEHKKEKMYIKMKEVSREVSKSGLLIAEVGNL